jgi:hypothetical protein
MEVDELLKEKPKKEQKQLPPRKEDIIEEQKDCWIVRTPDRHTALRLK